jgi:regulator of nonsense transcripts 1
MEHPFFCSIWAPSSSKSWRPEVRNVSTKPLGYCESSNLNSSQDNAVQRIVSEADRDRLVLIQGPPGTGKTTVIAASVISIIKNGSERTVWLVAHSNIAVKNMAEKLVKVDFSDFRILVSKDFHFDWYVTHYSPLRYADFLYARHEHLYTQLEHNLIRSDTFDEDIVAASQRALGARVMLCTLSMLSNPHIHAFTRIIPVHTIMFDEASQIEVGNYLPVLHRFKTSLQKMVFIGDDKQCGIQLAAPLTCVTNLYHSGAIWPR